MHYSVDESKAIQIFQTNLWILIFICMWKSETERDETLVNHNFCWNVLIHLALVYYIDWCHISKSNNNNTSTCTYTLLTLHIYKSNVYTGLYVTIKIAV